MILSHAMAALAVQAAVGFATGNWWAGAALGAGLFAGREHAQAEHRWIAQFTPDGRRRSMPWWGGFDPRVWGKLDAWADWLLPVAAVATIAIIMEQ